jgi:hypothetical protein
MRGSCFSHLPRVVSCHNVLLTALVHEGRPHHLNECMAACNKKYQQLVPLTVYRWFQKVLQAHVGTFSLLTVDQKSDQGPLSGGFPISPPLTRLPPSTMQSFTNINEGLRPGIRPKDLGRPNVPGDEGEPVPRRCPENI